MTKTSVQNALEDCMAKVREDIPITQQVFSRARQTIRWEAFAQTPAAMVQGSYEGEYKQWKGFRLMAIDGSSLQLPHSRELREYFGTQGNEAAKGSLRYDLENGLIVAAELERADGNEGELAQRHIMELAGPASFRRGHEELILCDRGYPRWELIERLEGQGIRYVMRAQRSFSGEADEAGEGERGKGR